MGGYAYSCKMMVRGNQRLVNRLMKVLSDKGFAESVLHWVEGGAGGFLWNPGDPSQSRECGRAGTGRHQSGAGEKETTGEGIWGLVE